jgi:hypothetical protein
MNTHIDNPAPPKDIIARVMIKTGLTSVGMTLVTVLTALEEDDVLAILPILLDELLELLELLEN